MLAVIKVVGIFGVQISALVVIKVVIIFVKKVVIGFVTKLYFRSTLLRINFDKQYNSCLYMYMYRSTLVVIWLEVRG